MEKTIGDIISNLYNNFILRDLFSKITPGFIFLSALYDSLSPLLSYFSINDLNFLTVIIILSISWIIGIALQSLGETCNIITICHFIEKENNKEKRYRDIDNWILLKSNFISKSTAEQVKFIERMTIIKEAAGNFAVSLLLSFTICCISNRDLYSKLSNINLFMYHVIIIIILISLFKMNYTAWKFEIKYMLKFTKINF